MDIPEADTADGEGRGREKRELKDALIASAQIAGEAKAWERVPGRGLTWDRRRCGDESARSRVEVRK